MQWKIASASELVSALDLEKFVAYDSEFVRGHFYSAKLALMQLRQVGAEVLLCDPEISSLQNFWQHLLLLSCPLVVHSGEQDLELIYRLAGALPETVADCQIAFAFLSLTRKISYADLCKKILSVEIDKTQCRSDWLARPLSFEQLRYAALDVFYLAEIFPILLDKLSALGRLDYFYEENANLRQTVMQRTAKQEHWFNLQNAVQMPYKFRAMAEALLQLREIAARKSDIHRSKLLSDGQIWQLAREYPDDIFSALSLLDEKNPIVNELPLAEEIFTSARENIPNRPRNTALNRKQKARLARLEEFISRRSLELQIAQLLLANKNDKRQLVLAEDEEERSKCRLLQGWRAEIFAEFDF
ncbi:MAG: hypothetical protein IJ566_00450 [Cardiobacteriaceae bacterium]|nr:hypothetical protein [Cardiobacteriaceae bacterium]